MGARATKHFLSDRSASSGGAGAGGSGNDSSETVAKFTYAEGRRFHGTEDVPYFLPNDDEEADRLHAQHFMLRAVVGGNYITPLNNPRRVIDVGTGPGTWIMEMATEFPYCECVGVDISPIQPGTVLPQNATFELMNALEGLRFEANAFDMVHSRFLSPAVPKTMWSQLVEDMARICVVEGVVEMCETDAMLRNPGPLGKQVNNWFLTVCSSRKIDMEHIWTMPEMMANAGLVVERTEYYEVPMGTWHGPLGQIGWHDLRAVVESVRPKIVQMCNISNEEIDTLLSQLPAEINANKSHWRMSITAGRKV